MNAQTFVCIILILESAGDHWFYTYSCGPLEMEKNVLKPRRSNLFNPYIAVPT